VSVRAAAPGPGESHGEVADTSGRAVDAHRPAPSAHSVTSSPTSATTPETSEPGVKGSRTAGRIAPGMSMKPPRGPSP
jgi:hypothetical protein